ncbi:MAG: hypothetical protein HY259_08840 [Chloroflexi bacterium]|nr:hypothetical protein [Chloroflexota bacterium]
MTTIIAVHEVENGEHWAQAWHQGAGSRHELVAKIGATARTFRDPQNPNLTALLFEVPDMMQFQALMQSDEASKGMGEDGVKRETLRLLSEFTP